MKTITPPIPESYWVVAPCFLAGEYPATRSEQETQARLKSLLIAGIDTFLDLTYPGELDSYLPILGQLSLHLGIPATHQRFPIEDFGLPTREQMTSILNAIDSSLAAGHRVYLHCWGGIGRTGTTVGCYLVRHGDRGEQALQCLAEWWRSVPKSIYHPQTPETFAQRQFILDWHELA